MTPEQIDLARRLVASERWGWPDGEHPREDLRIRTLQMCRLPWNLIDGIFLPDLGSPLVVGWLAHLVREAFYSVEARRAADDQEWSAYRSACQSMRRWVFGSCPDPTPELIAALLAAPETP